MAGPCRRATACCRGVWPHLQLTHHQQISMQGMSGYHQLGKQRAGGCCG